MNKLSETIKDAMIDMQLLLRGVWRFHNDEGREFMGAVDDWLREHTDVPFLDELNVTCWQERDQVRGLPGVVWRLR